MSEPRILQFCHCYYGPFMDVARQYAVLFKDTPYKVTTVYLTEPPSDHVIAGSGSDEVLFLGYAPKDVRGLKVNAMRRLREIVAQRDFKLVIAHRFKPIYIASMATRLPVIGVHHAFGDYERWSHQGFFRLFKRRLHLLGVSDAIRDDIRRCVAPGLAEQVHTMHNHIDVEAARSQIIPKAQARDALGLPASSFIVGNVGRLHPDKDQATLLKGFAQAKAYLPADSLLVILGAGRLGEVLKKQAHDLGIAAQVRFLGQVPEARRYFAAFDLFALSSDHEPFGMVLLEAMAAEVPVIATNCGGAPEVVGEPARLFPLGDEAALSQLIVESANWSAEDVSQIAREQMMRLNEKFSDVSARRQFLELQAVRASLPLLTEHV